MLKLSSFFSEVVRGDRNDIFDPPQSKNVKQDQNEYGDNNSICRLMLEAHTNYPHFKRIKLEKMRLAHRLLVVQNLEDNQRKNVIRSIQTDLGDGAVSNSNPNRLSLDELKAVYAYVKNAQLARVANPHLFQENTTHDPSTPFYDLYKIDFTDFSELHKLLSLWGCDNEDENEESMGTVLAERTFRLMDTNVDGLLNFKELVQVLEILCKADHVKKLKLFYCLHLPGLVLPGELDEENIPCEKNDKQPNRENLNVDIQENSNSDVIDGSIDDAKERRGRNTSYIDKPTNDSSSCKVACEAEEFFNVAKTTLTEMAEGLKLNEDVKFGEISDARTHIRDIAITKLPTKIESGPDGASDICIETSSLRSLVNRIFDSTNSYENYSSQPIDEIDTNTKTILSTEEQNMPKQKKRLHPLPRKNFLHLWRTLHNLFEYNVFTTSNLRTHGDNAKRDSDNVLLHMPSNGDEPVCNDRTIQDQLFQSITMVGTILLQIGEVGQRLKETQLKEKQNEQKRKVSRSKSGDDKRTGRTAEQNSMDDNNYVSIVPASYSCYDILAQPQDLGASIAKSDLKNDDAETNDEHALRLNDSVIQTDKDKMIDTEFSEKKSMLVDPDDWSITFEQFLASILNESCLVTFFDQKVDILQKLKVRRYYSINNEIV